MNKIAWVFLALLVVACDQLGGKVCTDIGCQSSYELVFNADDSLSIGDYSVSLRQEDDQLLTCSFTLSQIGPPCTGMECITNTSCEPLEVGDFRFSQAVYYALPEEEIHLFFPPLEGELTIIINQNGEMLTSLVTEPAYQTSQPNGPGCDPICTNARNEIRVTRQ